jgi:hypothetical protein
MTISHPRNGWLRRQIIKRPKWVAERVGIEKIGYLRDVQEPELVPTLDVLKRIWDEHFMSSAEQRRKCPVAFEDLRRAAGIKSIEEIKPDLVVKYRDEVRAEPDRQGPEQSLHARPPIPLFFRDRAIAIDTINRVIG